MPSVSIITPCFNSEKYLACTIESVIAQTFKDWEMFIIDDCSADASYSIAKRYAEKDKRIKVFKNDKNMSACYCRNFAITLSSAKYIAFLDSDDIWHPQKLETQIDFMKKNNCDFSFSEYELIDSKNKLLNQQIRVINHLTYKKNLIHNFPGCLTVMYDRESIGLIDGQKEGMADDFSLFLNALKRSKNAMGIKKVLAQYRKHKSSISYNRIPMIKNHFYVLHTLEKKPFILSVFFLITHITVLLFWKKRKV